MHILWIDAKSYNDQKKKSNTLNMLWVTQDYIYRWYEYAMCL